MFIQGTCKCEECLEHEQVMQSFTPNDLPIDQLDNPGWDPICFASDEAFAYLMPCLVKLALCPANEYIPQFLFHLGCSERIAAFTKKQTKALIHVLDFLVLEEMEALNHCFAFDELNRIREKLELIAVE